MSLPAGRIASRPPSKSVVSARGGLRRFTLRSYVAAAVIHHPRAQEREETVTIRANIMAIRERRLLEARGASPGGTLISRTTPPTIGTILRVRKIRTKAPNPRSHRLSGNACLGKEATGKVRFAFPLATPAGHGPYRTAHSTYTPT